MKEVRGHSFESRRTDCPNCGHHECFARALDIPGSGKCFSCGKWITTDNMRQTDNRLLARKNGSILNLRKKSPQRIQENNFKDTPEYVCEIVRDISPTFQYTFSILDEENRESREERAGIVEFDGGYTREQAEGYAMISSDVLTSMTATELERLRMKNEFAALMIEMTQPSILTDWSIGWYDGKTLFWHKDIYGRYLNAKTVRFNGFRSVKESTRFLYPGFKSCLFGEHQLADSNQSIVLVESEKTAILCSYHAPQYIWLASGGTDGLGNKVKVLRDRDVLILFDCDKAGREGADRAAENILKIGGSARIIDQFSLFHGHTNDGFDAGDYIYNKLILGI
jgi:hypothetical protein